MNRTAALFLLLALCFLAPCWGQSTDYIAGTSMGGLAGGFYASGMAGPEMRRRVEKLDWNQLVASQLDYKSLAFRRKEDGRNLRNTIVMGLRHGLLRTSVRCWGGPVLRDS